MMNEQYRCNKCGYILKMKDVMCSECGTGYFEHLRWTKGGDGSHWEGCAEAHLDCRIAQLEAELARLNAERRWIPVSERLPEDCVDVIVCEIMIGFKCVSVGFYDEAGSEWFSKSEVSETVTHWMPLPEPPNADDFVGDSDHEHDDRIL